MFNKIHLNFRVASSFFILFLFFFSYKLLVIFHEISKSGITYKEWEIFFTSSSLLIDSLSFLTETVHGNLCLKMFTNLSSKVKIQNCFIVFHLRRFFRKFTNNVFT